MIDVNKQKKQTYPLFRVVSPLFEKHIPIRNKSKPASSISNKHTKQPKQILK